ncbi:GreA/GreB family elongation factor [Flavobacterium granuli]|uniref:Regulator of nucleoside diphosphate kinase n=1 Tax=Flavobacterium granuli TaxID=280093 RepID=A0A1M5LGA7_9FLAO|nr:GreA/GreB family elongation factor [Flavobacterium granuli]PRZ23967.1 regulator of nucleoside diphosphate kinase [Flavobacterium granuli]SHG63996.1 regulator of nucleoside diphosphate kinase [Flavobacterium granuli]
MKYGQLIVDEREYALLMRNIESSRSQEDKIYRDSIKKLKTELLSAKIKKEGKMPEDVIRYNSVVRIRTPFNTESSYQIVTPEKSNIKQNKISILSPMGLALFGYAKGDRIVWQFPSGTNEIEIIGVSQQEIQLNTEVL